MTDFEEVITQHPDVAGAKSITHEELPPELIPYKQGISSGLAISLNVGQATYDINLWQWHDFPDRLPKAYLSNPSDYDFHNHVNSLGEICYTDTTVPRFTNPNLPKAIIHQCISEIGEVLSTSFGRDLTPLYDEFEGYWRSLPNCFSKVDCFWNPGDSPSPIYVLERKGKPVAVIKRQKKDALYGGLRICSQTQRVKAYYIPLKRMMLPPLPGETATTDYLRSLLQAIPNDQKIVSLKAIDKILRKKGKATQPRTGYLVFSTPRPSGEPSLFGLKISGQSSNPIEQRADDEQWTTTPLEIDRHYAGYLINRGGASLKCSGFKIGVVGCGAVGSRVAEFLCQAGFQQLTLIDHDTLSKDNIYRHSLGGESIGQKKVEALAINLQQRLPDIKTTPIPLSWQQYLATNKLDNFDLLICATGEATQMRAMNQEVLAQQIPLPTIYCWVEPDSIAGHSLLIDPTQPGCFECLVQNSAQGLYLKGSVTEPHQKISKELYGCGSFIPFTVTDAVKTAAMATELAVDYLLNKVPNVYKSWRGDTTHAQRSQLTLSSNPFSDSITNFKNPTCPLCKS